MQELEEEKRQKKRHADGKIKREVIWHQVDGIAGYYG